MQSAFLHARLEALAMGRFQREECMPEQFQRVVQSRARLDFAQMLADLQERRGIPGSPVLVDAALKGGDGAELSFSGGAEIPRQRGEKLDLVGHRRTVARCRSIPLGLRTASLPLNAGKRKAAKNW